MRRTQRRYSDRPVPDALVRLLLAAAFSASSKSDFQQASALWLQDRDRRDRLASLFPDMPWIGTAPVFLVFLGDARRLDRLGELRGKPAGQRRARRLLQRDGRRGAGHADLHPGRRDGRARHLPDQRAAQPHRRSRRDPRTARQGVPGRRAVPRLPGAARASSACACRRRRPCISTATTIPGWTRRWTATTGGATRAIRSRTASASPAGSASPSSTAGPRTRRGRPRPRRAPASRAWLKAHGFTLDEP